MPFDIDKTTAGFPHPTVDPIIGLPNYQSIKEMHVKLNANAASVYTNFGDGKHGLLRLTVAETQYNTVAIIHFVAPTNPGILIYSVNASAPKMVKEKEAHGLAIISFREYTLVDNALKQLLLNAVEDKYYRVLRDSLIGYANVTARTLIKHLFTTYCDIVSTQLTANDAQLCSAYNPNQPIESLYEQIDSAVVFAASVDNEYTSKQIVSIVYELIFQVGVYADDRKRWRKKSEADQT